MPDEPLATLQRLFRHHFDPRIRAGKTVTPCPDCGGGVELFLDNQQTGICTNCRTEFRFSERPTTRDDVVQKWLKAFTPRS